MEIAKKEQEELKKALKSSLEAQEKQTAEAEKLSAEVKQSTVQPPSKPSAVESKQAAKTTPPESKPAPKPSPVKSKSSTKDTKASEKSKLTGLPPLPGQPKKPSNAASDAAAGWIQSAKDDAAGNSTVKQTAQVNDTRGHASLLSIIGAGFLKNTLCGLNYLNFLALQHAVGFKIPRG